MIPEDVTVHFLIITQVFAVEHSHLNLFSNAPHDQKY